MNAYSVTIAGLLVVIAGWVGIGDIVTSDTASVIVNNVIQLIGIITAIVGRYRQGDLSVLGFKK